MLVKPDEGEGPSEMFFVTFDAVPVVHATMKAPSLGDAGPEFHVATETASIVNSLPERMAGCAVVHPLQRRVGGREFSRRYLARRQGGQYEERHQNHSPLYGVYQIHVYPNATATTTWISRISTIMIENGK